MSDEKILTETELDALFRDMSAAGGDIPDSLVSRIVADADTLALDRQPKNDFGLSLSDHIKSWFQIARLATLGIAATIGLWVGYAPPSNIVDFYPLGQESITVNDFLFSIDAILEEG